MKPLVSILIPAFNAERWVEETLRSAIGQTWEPKEIIVVDDGSTDGTLQIARRFESDVLRVWTQSNRGAAATRNRALSLSRGEYIQWLDADDLLAPDKIALQMEAAERCADRRRLLSGPWAYFLSRPKRATFVSTPLWHDLSPVEWLIRKMGQNLHMQTATWLVSRELTEAAGPWNERLLADDDGEYFGRVLLASNGVRFVPEARVYYRLTGAGRLSYIGESDRKLEAQWRSMKLHVDFLMSLENSERTRKTCVQYLQNWSAVFHPLRPDLRHYAQRTAAQLGGELTEPPLSWKYAWIRSVFGWGTARRAQLFLPRVRWSALRIWDRMLWRLRIG